MLYWAPLQVLPGPLGWNWRFLPKNSKSARKADENWCITCPYLENFILGAVGGWWVRPNIFFSQGEFQLFYLNQESCLNFVCSLALKMPCSHIISTLMSQTILKFAMRIECYYTYVIQCFTIPNSLSELKSTAMCIPSDVLLHILSLIL